MSETQLEDRIEKLEFTVQQLLAAIKVFGRETSRGIDTLDIRTNSAQKKYNDE